ncbi:MAG TPA: LacI family DNA-binding transcriptional regulator [Chloroflexia bacterium]|nr:LacI family DNA-binding transcriptional regulator [Chloroflexia bacterium]
MPKAVITIREVAAKAGVSVSTVSHVLNGNDQHVSQATRERVLEVVRSLNYRPNAIARSMIKRATATIGLVITDLQNPLFAPVAEGVEAVLRDQGYQIILASSTGLEGEIRAIETLRQQQVDGFIFMALSVRYPSDHLLKLNDEGVPFVLINRYIESNKISRVHFDDYGAGQTGTRHLLNLGHRRIGSITGPLDIVQSRRSALDRHRGWLDTLAAEGIKPPPEWVIEGDYSFESGYEAAQDLLYRIPASLGRPDALFVANDAMAMGALKALYEAGVGIPNDIAVVTVGDPPFAAFTIPALTTVALPVMEAGKQAARILLEKLKSPKPLPAQNVKLDCTLIVRESCGAKLHRI